MRLEKRHAKSVRTCGSVEFVVIKFQLICRLRERTSEDIQTLRQGKLVTVVENEQRKLMIVEGLQRALLPILRQLASSLQFL